VGFAQPEEEKAPGRPHCSFSVLKRWLRRMMGRGFLVGPVAIGQRVMALN